MCGKVEEALRKSQICQLTASIRRRLGCRLGLTGADQADMAHQQLLSHLLPVNVCAALLEQEPLLLDYETMHV